MTDQVTLRPILELTPCAPHLIAVHYGCVDYTPSVDEQKALCDELWSRYNTHDRLVEALRDAADAMEAFNRAPGATRDEWEFECEVKEINTLLSEIERGE